MELRPYTRKINYYETDQMHVVHHSNYARYLEECRLDMMEQMGLSYDRLEEMGIIIPVLELHCKFTYALHFGDTVVICPRIVKVSPVKFIVEYEIRDTEGKVLHRAETSHGFVGRDFRPISLKKNFPEVYQLFKDLEGNETVEEADKAAAES